MSESAISIRDLQKTYQGGKRALDGVSIEVPRGASSMRGGGGLAFRINRCTGTISRMHRSR